ncbi:DegT/DnrJ/EryC1/StrS family aminotransferase [Marinobacter nauticus]|uniref:DegT/DnrJ/EryC1/StrS family aminotransferase n=1 Tax=Marinobacter nauticus TaxID=2743 RepID=UPI001CD5BE07|nr:DegT/DnrJ/EryC1/StrS family aminotransferase [Marinobacter nauticus]MCA0911878.1 DegT/DnrJ/EryC1/StrS family aminotransferase [Marinobacter nauticus]
MLNSGTAALSLALRAAKRQKPEIAEPEAIFPAYVCPDLVAAAVAAGVKPVLVDLAKDSPWMAPQNVQGAVSDNTIAIIAVNFLGRLVPLEPLRRVADDYGLTLIEDSAQAIPPSSADNALADFVVLSFGRGKPVNLMGGGALLFKDKDAASVALLLEGLPVHTVVCNPVWYLKRALFHTLMRRWLYGIMLRIPMLHLGETRFHPLGDITRLSIPPGLVLNGISAFERSEARSREQHENLGFLAQQGWVLLSNEQEEARQAERQGINKVLRFAMLAPDRTQRDSALNALQDAGIGANELYGVTLPMVEGVDNYLEPSPGKYPNAQSFAERLITLPSHDGVTLADIRTMARVLKR